MRLWMGVMLFFGLGVSIGVSVAAVMLAHGSSAFSAEALGGNRLSRKKGRAIQQFPARMRLVKSVCLCRRPQLCGLYR